MKKISKSLAFILVGLSLVSCRIGLGKEIDVIAPSVEVLNPERNSSVPQVINVKGIAKDNIAVSNITIFVEESAQEFKFENKKWYTKEVEEWKEFPDGSYSGELNNFTWEVNIPVANAKTGDTFTITTKVTDQYLNEGKDSKDERKVLVDVKEPVVSINTPVITNDYTTASANSASYELCNNNYLQNLINQDIEISGYQKEDSQLDYLIVILDKGTDKDYLPALSTEITDYLFKKECTGSLLKNWTVTIPQSELSEYQTGKHLFRLITESHDKAGNVERKIQGWFTYWNDADSPWVYADFGKDKTEFDTLRAENRLSEANIYPGCSLQGQAYDDDGLKSITISTWISKNGQWTLSKQNTIDLDSEKNPKYYAWTVYAPAETCEFFIEASCTDIYGNSSIVVDTEKKAEAKSLKKYMNVSDVNPPRITVTTSTQTSLFGDASGNFKIEGNITDDDVDNIPELVLVWIKNLENQKNYVNTEYEGWKSDISASTGDKRFVITLPPRDVNKPQYYGEFSKQLNIFTDLNIGIEDAKNKLNTQVFALKAKDIGGQSSTSFISFSGDYTKPVLTIDYLTVDGGSAQYFYEEGREESLKLSPYTRDSDGNITSKIKLFGSWSDDSTNTWTDKTKIGTINLTWTGINTSIPVTMTNDGKWESVEVIPPDSSTASITATLKDIGNNLASANECFNINLNRPELVRFTTTASTKNGYYKTGDKIEIVMEFNKNVKFSGTVPKLKLNIGTEKYATYSSGNESAVHKFVYTVADGDSTTDLDVIAIQKDNDTKWFDVTDENTLVANIAIPAVDANKLKGNRDIIVDTIKPLITNVTGSSNAGAYNKDKELYFILNFNEEVTISDLSNTKLLFNGGITSTEVSKTGPSTLLFKYKVNTENTSALTLNAVQFGNGVTVKDNAGNELSMDTESKVSVSDDSGKTFVIDTIAPGNPSFTYPAFNDGNIIYENTVANPIAITITYADLSSDTQKKYSVASKNSSGAFVKGVYNNYTAPVQISTNGTYKIYAKQIDAAGNEGTETVSSEFTIDLGNVLTNVTANRPNGVYSIKNGTADTITVELVFRKAVTIESGKIKLNIGTGFEVDCDDGNTLSTSHKFTYTVQNTHNVNTLNLIDYETGLILSGTVKDSSGNTIPSDYYKTPDGHSFIDNRSSIEICNTQPEVSSVSLSGTTLTVQFSSEVVKGTGNIVLTHETGYKAPAIFPDRVYSKLSAAQKTTLETYYELGTNGLNADGTSDLTEKRILKYTYDTNNEGLLTALTGMDADKVSIPVNSSYVTVSGNTVTVNLEDSYELPVKGAGYAVSVSAGFVKDSFNHSSSAYNSSSETETSKKTVSYAGIEKPVIRINKANESFTIKDDKVTGVTQPATAGVKIDCQTPGVSKGSGLTWLVKRQTNSTDTYGCSSTQSANYPHAGGKSNNVQQYYSKKIEQKAVSWDSNDATDYSSLPFTIGSSENILDGYIYLITATASKNGEEETNLEKAYRTVYKLLNPETKTDLANQTGNAVGNTYPQLWMRGGDSSSGGLSTSSFPISWNSTEFTKVRAMTKDPKSTNNWYFISWNINSKAYPNPLRGDLPDTLDEANKGPTKWSWGMQGPISTGLENYILYPGQSITMDAQAVFVYGNMSFYNKHCEYRSGDVVIKSKKTDN